MLAPPTVFSSLTSEQPWEANTITILSDEEPEALGGNFTYPRSPPPGDMTLSVPHYLPEPPASSSEVQDTYPRAAVRIYEVMSWKVRGQL